MDSLDASPIQLATTLVPNMERKRAEKFRQVLQELSTLPVEPEDDPAASAAVLEATNSVIDELDRLLGRKADPPDLNVVYRAGPGEDAVSDRPAWYDEVDWPANPPKGRKSRGDTRRAKEKEKSTSARKKKAA